MTYDPFKSFATTPDDPLSNALEVTASDDADLPVIPRGVMMQNMATLPQPVRMQFLNDEVATVYMLGGYTYHLRPKRIFTTGTSEAAQAQPFTILW